MRGSGSAYRLDGTGCRPQFHDRCTAPTEEHHVRQTSVHRRRAAPAPGGGCWSLGCARGCSRCIARSRLVGQDQTSRRGGRVRVAWPAKRHRPSGKPLTRWLARQVGARRRCPAKGGTVRCRPAPDALRLSGAGRLCRRAPRPSRPPVPAIRCSSYVPSRSTDGPPSAPSTSPGPTTPPSRRRVHRPATARRVSGCSISSLHCSAPTGPSTARSTSPAAAGRPVHVGTIAWVGLAG